MLQVKAYVSDKLKSAEPVFTCCGQRMMTPQERVLEWLGGIGGFAGILVGVLSLFGPTHVEVSYECHIQSFLDLTCLLLLFARTTLNLVKQ